MASALLLYSCTNNSKEQQNNLPKPIAVDSSEVPAPEIIEPEVVAIDYDLVSKDSFKTVSTQYSKEELAKIAAINRVDPNLLRSKDTIVIPQDLSKDEKVYFPFPDTLSFLAEVNKMIIFSYPTQAFAAYEKGKLVLTGPTSLGKKSTKTPRGLFYTNWKARRSISTSNSEWILNWNFNVQNKMGVGFHQYQLPGYPASHSCMRLRNDDANWLYNWADQWVLKNQGQTVAYYGTPVLVYGNYPWGERRPWLDLADNAEALKITETDLRNELTPEKMQQIMDRQKDRMAYEAGRDSTASM